MPAEREVIVRIAKGLTVMQKRLLALIEGAMPFGMPSDDETLSFYEGDEKTIGALEWCLDCDLLDEVTIDEDNFVIRLSRLGQAVRDHLKESTHE